MFHAWFNAAAAVPIHMQDTDAPFPQNIRLSFTK